MTVARYGLRDTIEIALIDSIWYDSFGNTPGRTASSAIRVRMAYGLAVCTTGLDSPADDIGTRYAARWPIGQPTPQANSCSASARPATACSGR